jgi:thiamine biosynthesis lipoprotein
VPVSADLWRVLTAAGQLSEKSDGAFDVTVGPYVKLWRRARREKELPSLERLAEARAAVGYKHLRLAMPGKAVRPGPEEHTARLTQPGMGWLGSIAAAMQSTSAGRAA